MRLYYENLGIEMEIQEDEAIGLAIESPVRYRNLVKDILLSREGADAVSICDGAKKLKWDKDIAFILNPMLIDFGEKKVISKIYDELEIIANAELIEQITEINSQWNNLIEQVSLRLSYPIDYEPQLNLQAMLKASLVQIDEEGQELPEKLVNYIRLIHQATGISVFFFCNLMDYLTENEFREIEETLKYEHVYMLIISTNSNRMVCDKYWIVDDEDCIIKIGYD